MDNLCLFCAYFHSPSSSFTCLLLQKPFLNRNVSGKTWISIKQTAQLALAVGLAVTSLLVARELVESFCHVPKGSWGMVYRWIGLNHTYFLFIL